MSSSLTGNWYKIAESIAEIEFSTNGLAELEVNGKKFCVGLQHDRVFACAQKCPHAGGSLASGYLDAAGNIVCPLHRYKFDTKNGRNISGEGYHLKTYPVELRNDGVFIQIDKVFLF